MRGVGRGGQQLKTMEDNLFNRCSMLSLNPLPWRSSSKCHPRHFFKSKMIPKRRFKNITVAIKLEKNKQNPLSALGALLLAQITTKICL